MTHSIPSFRPGLLLSLLLLALATGCEGRAPGQAGAPADEHRDDAHEEHGHEEEGHDHDHEEGEADFAAINPGEAGRHGIEMATAAPGTLAETLTLTGRLVMDPTHVALVRARFPGPVVAVTRDLGDPVARGQVLARVESNESLSVYDVRSPVAGVVLERHTHVGDVAGSEPLFRVGDPEKLLAELTAFPSQQGLVRRGASVRVQLGGAAGAAGTEVAGTVTALVPEVEGHTQALRVRVALDFDGPPPAVPGQFVTARVSTGSTAAPVVVPAAALLRLEGRDVVFVPEEQGFRARPVVAGARTGEEVALTAGLAPGERYVARGAFLLKAEIGKNLAEHTH